MRLTIAQLIVARLQSLDLRYPPLGAAVQDDLVELRERLQRD